jgi:hypothetical protein
LDKSIPSFNETYYDKTPWQYCRGVFMFSKFCYQKWTSGFNNGSNNVMEFSPSLISTISEGGCTVLQRYYRHRKGFEKIVQQTGEQPISALRANRPVLQVKRFSDPRGEIIPR